MTIKKLFLAFLGVLLFLMGLLLVALFSLENASDELIDARESQYESYLLADELRQSSDDLTRFARLYVTTGDQIYQQQYQNIIDVRAGKKPRPDGILISLKSLMEKAGFTQQEFKKLSLAEQGSSNLAQIEYRAMSLINKNTANSNANSSAKNSALTTMYGNDYLKYKANIMVEIDDFFNLLNQRTGQAVLVAEKQKSLVHNLVIVLIIAVLLILSAALLFSYKRIIRALGGEPGLARKIVREVAAGNLGVTIPVVAGDTTSLLASMKLMQSSLQELIGEIQKGASHVTSSAEHLVDATDNSADASRRQSDASTTIATAIEESTVNINQMSESAQSAQKFPLSLMC